MVGCDAKGFDRRSHCSRNRWKFFRPPCLMFKRPSHCIFRHVNMLASTSVHHHRVPVCQKVPKDLRLKSVPLGDYTDGRVLGIEKIPSPQ